MCAAPQANSYGNLEAAPVVLAGQLSSTYR